MKFLIGLRNGLLISLLIWAVAGICFAAGHTISAVPVPDGEIIEDNIKKYDITTYKKVKDIEDMEFTVIDKIERIDLHQLEYDNAQDQNEIDRITLKIPELQDRIAERNLLIAEIKKQNEPVEILKNKPME